MVFVKDTVFPVFYTAAVFEIAFDELLVFGFFLRLHKVEQRHLRLLLALSVLYALLVLLGCGFQLILGFFLFGFFLEILLVLEDVSFVLFGLLFLFFIKRSRLVVYLHKRGRFYRRDLLFRLFGVEKFRKLCKLVRIVRIFCLSDLRHGFFLCRSALSERFYVGKNVFRLLPVLGKNNAVLFEDFFDISVRRKLRNAAHRDAFGQTDVAACESEVEFFRNYPRVLAHDLIKISHAEKHHGLRVDLLRFQILTI